MMKTLRQLAAGLLVCCALCPWSAAWAVAGKALPNDIVRGMTDKLLIEIEAARGYYGAEPERFYQQVDNIISPVIDYRRFSRAVMGRYGTSSYYKQLETEEEKQALKGQVLRFTDAVQARMVRTLSKGLMTFSGERIDVLPPDPVAQQRIANKQSVSVVQLIYRDQDQPLEVQFKLKPDKAGDWRMINVVLNNINLGKQYRTEFSSKLKEFGGDIDKVIDYWRNVEFDLEEGVDATAAN
jgi:phospholipid transport system substrate-binding protein